VPRHHLFRLEQSGQPRHLSHQRRQLVTRRFLRWRDGVQNGTSPSCAAAQVAFSRSIVRGSSIFQSPCAPR
jgi:hypothetical protein